MLVRFNTNKSQSRAKSRRSKTTVQATLWNQLCYPRSKLVRKINPREDFDRVNVTKLENAYSGERVFMIGNGPSLKETPLEELETEYTIGVNNINALYNEIEWRPDFYYYHDSDFDDWQNVVCENIQAGVDCFIWEEHRQLFGDADNAHYMTMYDLIPRAKTTPTIFHERDIEDIDQLSKQELYNYWSTDISDLVYHHHSMYGMYQILFYLGFDEIYLIGTDLGFEPVTPHMIFDSGKDPLQYDSKTRFLSDSIKSRTPFRSGINGILFKILTSDDFTNISEKILSTVSAEDGDHFISDYNLSPRDYTHLNYELPRNHHVVKRIASQEGVDIYNATLGGELEVFPRVDFGEILNSESVL